MVVFYYFGLVVVFSELFTAETLVLRLGASFECYGKGPCKACVAKGSSLGWQSAGVAGRVDASLV